MNIKEFMRDVVLNWIIRRDNPHEVTAAQAGAYTKEEIESKVERKLPIGVLPIYAYGDDTEAPIPYRITDTRLNIDVEIPVLFYGTPVTSYGTAITPPKNTITYITIELGPDGYGVYRTYSDRPINTPKRILIGLLETDADKITRHEINKVSGVYLQEAPY